MKEKIIRKLDDIAQEIRIHIESPLPPGLFSGTAGVCLFLFLYSLWKKSELYYQFAYSTLSKTLDNISDSANHTFCSGVSGICWLIDYLCDNKIIESYNRRIVVELLPFIRKKLLQSAEIGDFDFLHGAIGSAMYLLNRSPHKGMHIHNQIIDSLEKHIISTSTGGYWEYYWNELRNSKHVNISIAHGMASTCIYLVNLINSFKLPNARNLLEKAIQYIIKQEYLTNSLSSYPTFSQDYDLEKGIANSRLGWCYGDIGIALLYWNCYKMCFGEKYKEMAIKLFAKISDRKTLLENGIIDAGICHGTSGLGLVFYKMFLNTGNLKFKETSSFWLSETMKFSIYQDGYAGYKANGQYASINFLEGISGIGLYLLSQVNPRFLGWERVLLIN